VALPSDPYKDPTRVPQGYVLGVGGGTAAFLKRLRGLSRLMYRVFGEWYLRQLDRTVIRSVRAKVVQRLSSAIAASKGRVLLSARVENVTRDADGAYLVVGTTASGSFATRAPTLVLATGGFQGNQELLSEHLGKGGSRAMCRAVHTNRGDGLRVGRALGGAVDGPMDRFYGYPMAVLPRPIDHRRDPIALLTCSAYYAGNSVLVDQRGSRFVDEPAAAKNSELSYAVAARADGECWAILDERTRQRFGMKEFGGGLLPPINLIQSAASRGALIIVASTLEELVAKLGEHQVDRLTLTATLKTFNDAVRDHTEAQLTPGRSSSGPALEVTPFYAVSLIPGVSMTYGGLRVNGRAQVLSADGTPVRGLFAIPGVAGGLYHQQYGGALAACGTFGRIAGRGCD
jgi:predicted oxidoreductase